MKKSNAIVMISAAIFVAFFGLILMSGVYAVTPSGGTVTVFNASETAPEDVADSEVAYAGNITGINIQGFTTTAAWQGYYGNVTGTIQLADAADNVLYNWTLASPEGEIFASTNNSIDWTSIQCFNFTADGTEPGPGAETAGATSVQGLNLTQLETRFTIASDDVDGVNETFNYTINADGHDLFYVASLEFSDSECLHTKPFGDSGGPAANEFEEVLMYEPATGSVVFAAILEESAVTGFNNRDNDFQMLVLEDGHGTDTVTTTYYFFVELE
jgi:hypothetical protein